MFYNLEWYKDVFGPDKTNFRIIKAHGEEVSKYPSNAVNVGRSENCPHEVAIYGDHIASFQGHPAFTEDLMRNEIGPSCYRQGFITESMREDGEKALKLADCKLLDLVVSFLRSRSVGAA